MPACSQMPSVSPTDRPTFSSRGRGRHLVLLQLAAGYIQKGLLNSRLKTTYGFWPKTPPKLCSRRCIRTRRTDTKNSHPLCCCTCMYNYELQLHRGHRELQRESSVPIFQPPSSLDRSTRYLNLLRSRGEALNFAAEEAIILKSPALNIHRPLSVMVARPPLQTLFRLSVKREGADEPMEF